MSDKNGTTALTTTEAGLPVVFNEAQRTILRQRTPPEEIRTRPGKGGKQFKYIEHSYVTELLNKAFSWDWDFIIASRDILENEVIVEGALTVRTPQGQTIIKQQFGGSDIKRDRDGKDLSVADDLKAAASDALKKCASLLGIGLDVYGRDGYGDDTLAQVIPPKRAQPQPPGKQPTLVDLRVSIDTLKERHWTADRIKAEYLKVIPDDTPSPELTPAQVAKVAAHFDGLVREPVTA